MQIVPTTLLGRFTALVPEPYRGLIETGLRDLELPAAKVALEVLEIERLGVAYGDAVMQETRWPQLSRFHHGIRDLLQYELPPALVADLRLLMREVARGPLDELRRDLVLAAANSDGVTGGLLRAVLIEALWLNVVLAHWDDGGVLEASGCLDRAGQEAEELVSLARGDPLLREDGVRPLHVLVGGLLDRVAQMWSDIAPQVLEQAVDWQRQFETAAEACYRSRAMGAQDAAIVRNVTEQMRTGEPVGSQRLVDRHPGLFPTANAVDKRRSRLVACGSRRDLPKPVRTRIVDLLREEVES